MPDNRMANGIARRPSQTWGAKPAFTLIELVVVIVLMGILATLAVISLGGTMDQYRLGRAAETIEMFDARARRDASRLRVPVQAKIWQDRNRLTIGRQTEFRLPATVEIKQVRTGRRRAGGRDVEIEFNRDGRSPTYAVAIERGNQTRWLVVLGISGQVIALDNEGEVDELLSL